MSIDLCMIIFWAVPLAGLFAGTAFKYFQSALWICGFTLAMYFCLLTPNVAGWLATVLPGVSRSTLELLVLTIGVPVLTFLFVFISYTLCESEFSVYTLPRGLNTIGQAVNGAVFGMLLTDFLLFSLLMTSGHAGIPDKESRELAKLCTQRTNCIFQVVNAVTLQESINRSCQNRLEELIGLPALEAAHAKELAAAAEKARLEERTARQQTTGKRKKKKKSSEAAENPGTFQKIRNRVNGSTDEYRNQTDKAAK